MNKYYFFFGEGSKVNQYICAILINLAVLAYGAAVGWMSPMTLLLQSDQSPAGAPLSDTVVSWMASVSYMVCIPATLLFAGVEERLGRKAALLGMSSCMAVVLSQTTGNLVMYVVGDYLSYRGCLWFCLALPAVHIVLFLMMPESPSYLVKNGELEEAARVVAWLRCSREDSALVKAEIDKLQKEQDNDKESSKFAMKAIWSDNILRRAFYIALAVTLAREVCGANPVLNFAAYIFELADSGLVLSPNQQAMMLGAVQVAGSALASSVVEKAGRKPLLFTSSLISGASMCVLASWFVLRARGVPAPGWLPVSALCLCIFCDAAGLQPISMVVMNEIFSFKYRSSVSAVTMGLASSTDFVQLLTFKPLANSIGIEYCFYFFGAVCLVNSVYVIFKLPETKQRSLEEIYEKLKTKKERESEKVKAVEA
ncbi:hypothetical protein JYU34_015491 [Plutella xylostella]|uniref:Major facilitator superfamily (MFS) profile domain-containing protein n=1 Tax=Plutella xylostella TaxID=51655 RepID=A0ABQ7Q785_PLUXY|nr:hypothetical protein JYU34_015491 [Plutella xylostella]